MDVHKSECKHREIIFLLWLTEYTVVSSHLDSNSAPCLYNANNSYLASVSSSVKRKYEECHDIYI